MVTCQHNVKLSIRFQEASRPGFVSVIRVDAVPDQVYKAKYWRNSGGGSGSIFRFRFIIVVCTGIL